ncbi:MAG: amidohydrolase [Planctomycetota bacterium]|nr:MAG: amidohydrolase [Planctomycetota bacterium]
MARLLILSLVMGGFHAMTTPTLPAQAPADKPPADKQDKAPVPSLELQDFRPKPALKVDEHDLQKAKFPVVDVHVHPKFRLRHSAERLDDFVKVMDAQNIAVCVSLDGGMGSDFDEHSKYLWTKYPDRFVIFANIDWMGDGKKDDPGSWACQRPGFARRMADELAKLKKKGCSGLKVFKNLGLVYRNPDGSLMRVDDPRWGPIWEACGTLGLPVLIHTGDPKAFFDPIDETNERWEELKRHPDWSFYGQDYPSYKEVLGQFTKVVESYPQTTFIAAHVANSAHDLGQVTTWLGRYPNMYVDIAARIGELGRQPYTARKFFESYKTRILFATDGPRDPKRLHYHWRFLETYDEYFPYAENPFPPQGFWRIYGVGLSEDVLRDIYYRNAERAIPGVKEKYEAYVKQQKKD